MDNQCRTTEELYDECNRIVKESEHVSITPSKYVNFDHAFVENPEPVSMVWYLSEDTDDHQQAFGEFIVSSAFNGGYWYDTDPVTQWEVNGSGSMAMEKWIREELFNNGLHPYHCQDRQKVIKKLYPSLDLQPNAAHRKRIISELAFNNRRFAEPIMRQRHTNREEYTFNWLDVSFLADCLPESFGGDPYLKKACLVYLIFTGWLRSKGIKVTADFPIPTDYQMPRIFQYEGAIDITVAFENELNAGKLVDVTSPEVMAFRAAGIVVAHELAERYGLDDYQIDNVLFSLYRKDENFIKNSVKPMRCMSMWF